MLGVLYTYLVKLFSYKRKHVCLRKAELQMRLEHALHKRSHDYFLICQLSQPPIGDNERHMQFVVRERVRGLKLPAARARGALLAELARELRTMRETHDHYKFGKLFSI